MRKILVLMFAVCVTPVLVLAADSSDTNSSTSTTPATVAATATSDISPNAGEGKLSRWLDMNTLSFSYRFRGMYDSDDFHLFDTGQERSLIDGRLKLDQQGKYSVNFHVSSGRYFNWAYADNIGSGFGDLAGASLAHFGPAELTRFFTSAGADPMGVSSVHVASRGWEMYVRQLSFSATPIKQLSLEFGSMGFERGMNSEITSYDEDGYVAGERIRVRDAKHLFFDQIAFTNGYVGDYFVPNFFDRGDRLTQANYHQFLVQKKLNNRLEASADFTSHNKADIMREAMVLRVPEVHLIDSARVELYQRMNDVTLQGATFGAANGYSIMGAKTFAKKFKLEAGYASIDEHYTVLTGSRFLDSVAYSLNADSWGIGPRFFTRANYKLDSYVSLFGFYTHQLSTDYYTLNKQGMNFGMTIDFKSLLSEKFHVL